MPMQGDREKCLKAGMSGYVAKPMKPIDLYTEITRVCEGGENEVAQEGSEPSAAPDENPGMIDWKSALETTGGDEDLLAVIAEQYLKDGTRSCRKYDKGNRRK